LRVRRARMGDQQLPEPVREHDLPGVQVPGEDQVPAAARDGVESPREVAEEDAERSIRVGEVARALVEPGPRVDAAELHLADAYRPAEPHRPVLEPGEPDPARESTARDRAGV